VKNFEQEKLKNMRTTRNIGYILLAVWLILMGLMELTSVAIPGVVMGLLALAAGVFILLNR
jgi:predicted transcriptional regulator